MYAILVLLQLNSVVLTLWFLFASLVAIHTDMA